MAVAYVTEYTNANHLSYVLGRRMAPSFQKKNVCLNLMSVEDVPADTNVYRFEKAGALTAEAHTEATAVSLSANGELTDTYIDATAAAICVVSARSIHARRFNGEKSGLPRFLKEQGEAIARYVDNDALGLTSGFSQTVTATSTLTFEDLALARYTIEASNCPDLDAPMAFIGAPKAFKDLGVQAIQSGAAAFANDALLAIFKATGGKPQANGYRGEIFPGIQGWMTTGFATGGGDTHQLLVHPVWGMAAIVDRNIIVKNAEKVEEGFYDSIGSVLFYDVIEYHDLACVTVKSDT